MILTHEAQPVRVYARRIIGKIPTVGKQEPIQTGWHFEFAEADTDKWCAFADPMLARYIPEVGDYLVTQEDGFDHFMPKIFFEQKYRRL